MKNYIRFEDMYYIVNISFVYIGLGECFQTRKRSPIFRRFQTVIFTYMTCMAAWGGFTGVYMFFYIAFTPENGVYTTEEGAQTLPPCFLAVLTVVVDVIIFSKKETNKEIIENLKEIYPKETEINEEQRSILMNKLRPVKKLIQFYTILTNLQPFLYSLVPVYVALIKQQDYKMPFTMWYPYDFTTSVGIYLATLYHQLMAATYTAFSLAAVDCGVVIVMVNISMHLELLGHRLRNIAPFKDTYTREDIQTANDNLEQIVKEHVHLIELLNKFKATYSSIFLCKYVATAVLICISLFSIMLSSRNRKFDFILFLSSTLIQMFIICYYGHDIIVKNEELAEAVYSAAWPDMDRRFKLNMLTLQARAQKTLELNAMGFAQVSLSAFTTIVKAGWSYFSIARQVFE